MLKLTNILKTVLLELADNIKPFSYRKTGDYIKKDSDSVYLHGSKYYNFDTEHNLSYEVQITYLGEDDQRYSYVDNEGQMVEIIFYTNGEEEEGSKNPFDTTNNPKEIYRVMGTIFDCIKEAREEEPFDYVIYQASDRKNFGKDPKAGEQRKKLYDYYFKKMFPGSKIENKDKFTIVTLK
jgi:hypothetical protein